MSESVDFGGERQHKLQKRVERPRVDIEGVVYCPECGAEFGVRPRRFLSTGFAEFVDLANQQIDSLLDTCERVVVRCRHEADAIRSGGEGQGPLGGEPASELRENRQVGVEPDAIQSANPEREAEEMAREPSGITRSPRGSGASQTDVAASLGLTRQSVYNAVKRATEASAGLSDSGQT